MAATIWMEMRAATNSQAVAATTPCAAVQATTPCSAMTKPARLPANSTARMTSMAGTARTCWSAAARMTSCMAAQETISWRAMHWAWTRNTTATTASMVARMQIPSGAMVAMITCRAETAMTN
ncbi:hypothetical protein D3C71_1290490 [compost metagenome]